jgi:hypothetical protein
MGMSSTPLLLCQAAVQPHRQLGKKAPSALPPLI